jgi:hypothetical protein
MCCADGCKESAWSLSGSGDPRVDAILGICCRRHACREIIKLSDVHPALLGTKAVGFKTVGFHHSRRCCRETEETEGPAGEDGEDGRARHCTCGHQAAIIHRVNQLADKEKQQEDRKRMDLFKETILKGDKRYEDLIFKNLFNKSLRNIYLRRSHSEEEVLSELNFEFKLSDNKTEV